MTTTELKKYVLNPNLSIEDIKLFSEDSRYTVRASIAANPSTPADILSKLGEDEDIFVKEAVSRNPNTSIETLKKLAADENSYIREGVSSNPSSNDEVLTLLAHDPIFAVRRSVISHKNASNKFLIDSYYSVSSKEERDFFWLVILNRYVKFFISDDNQKWITAGSKLTDSELEEIFKIKGDEFVEYVVKSSYIPLNVIEYLAKNSSDRAKVFLAYNKRVLNNILEELSHTDNKLILCAICLNKNASEELKTKIIETSSPETSLFISKTLKSQWN